MENMTAPRPKAPASREEERGTWRLPKDAPRDTHVLVTWQNPGFTKWYQETAYTNNGTDFYTTWRAEILPPINYWQPLPPSPDKSP